MWASRWKTFNLPSLQRLRNGDGYLHEFLAPPGYTQAGSHLHFCRREHQRIMYCLSGPNIEKRKIERDKL